MINFLPYYKITNEYYFEINVETEFKIINKIRNMYLRRNSMIANVVCVFLVKDSNELNYLFVIRLM